MTDSTGLHIYGGDPRIVAERDELLRVAVALRAAAATLSQAATFSWQDLAVDPALLPTSLGTRVFLASRLPSVQQRLEQLASACELAAEAYFSVETQVAREFFDRGVLPMHQLGALAHSPLGLVARPGLSLALGGATAALGLTGLVLLPRTQGTQLVRAAAAVAPANAGATTVPGFLEGLRLNLEVLGVPTLGAAAATLVSTGTVTPARSLEQHAARLHQSYAPGGSIRIEVYSVPGGAGPATGSAGRSGHHTTAASAGHHTTAARQFVVYLPGTQTAALGGTMPLDMRSNLKAMASPGLAASERAVTQALSQLDVKPTDRVLFIGHSQGALIANNLVASSEFRGSGLISLGGPLAHRPPTGVPVIALEHTNDPVPALSGRSNPLASNLATVQRELPASSVIEAHAMAGYRQTAALADAAANPGLVRVRDQLVGQLQGLGEGVAYRFELSRN